VKSEPPDAASTDALAADADDRLSEAPPEKASTAEPTAQASPEAKGASAETDGGPTSLEEIEPEPMRMTPPSKPPPQRGSSRPPAAGDSVRPLPPPTYRHVGDHSPTPAPVAPARQLPSEVVGDIMTRTLVAALETDTLESIEIGMKRFRFRHVPVVDGSNRLVGLVTRHDVMRGPPDAPEPEEGAPAPSWPKGTTVGSMMRRDVLTTRPTTPLMQAAKALLQKRIGCLPVIEEDNTLVGILTKADFLKLAIELLDKPRG
jgi:CBS domain-containing membrane protein